MTKIITLLLSLSLLAASCNLFSQSNTPAETKITKAIIRDYPISLEIVDSPATMARGLSYRERLAPDNGMLFDFTKQQNKMPSFWMKDMRFDLDIFWIANNTIIGIEKKVPRPAGNTPLPTYSPPGAIDYVLEMNAGWSEAHTIRNGDAIQFQ